MEIDNNLLIPAKSLAEKFHEGQKRKTGEPYFWHPLRMSNAARTTEEGIVALLHDVLEDTKCAIGDLKKAGFPDRVIDAVICLTRKKDETYFDFIFRIKNFMQGAYPDNLPTRVKLLDIADNMKNLEEGSLKDKYRFAKYILER